MTERNRGEPHINFNDGSRIHCVTRFTSTDEYTNPLPTLEFEARPPASQVPEYRAKLIRGEFVTLKIGNASQGGFLIQTVKRAYSADGGLTFHVEAVSPLITPYQGSVDPDIVNVHQQTDVSVSETILKALRPYGFDRIVTDARASVQTLTGVTVKNRKKDTDLAKLKIQDAQAQDGETAYQFCARIFTHLGVCMRMNPDGLLLVGTPDYDQYPTASVVCGSGEGDYFVDGFDVTETNDDQYSEVTTRGNRPVGTTTTQTSRPKSALLASEVLNPLSVYRSSAANFKPKNIRDKHARDPERCASVSKLVLGIRAHKAWVLEGTVDGFVSKTGAVWTVDTVVNAKIDPEQLREDLWVLSRSFTLDGNGAKTKLKLIPKGTLLLGDVSA